MSNNRQINNSQAIEQLTAAWNQTHAQEVDAWNQQVQVDLAEQEELTRLAEEEEGRCWAVDEFLKKEEEKKQPKINNFNENWMVSDYVMPWPSQFAIGKLKSFDIIELWYFTDKGFSKAQDSSRAQSNNTYSLTRVDNLVTLKLVTSFKASCNTIQDADLTWRQMNVGKNTMLWYMDLCNWPQKYIQSFAHFYFNIKLKLMCACPNGEKVLIMYQAKVRRQWHDDLAWGQGFNIVPINQKFLSVVAKEVWDAVSSLAFSHIHPSHLWLILTNPTCHAHYKPWPHHSNHLNNIFYATGCHAMPLTYQPCHATYTANCHAMPFLWPTAMPSHTLPTAMPYHTSLAPMPCHCPHHAMPFVLPCHTMHLPCHTIHEFLTNISDKITHG